MVVHDSYVVCIAIRPRKTDSELIVDTNAVLSGAFAFEQFQTIPRERRKILQGSCLIKLIELAPGGLLDRLETLAEFILEQPLRLGASEGTNQIIAYIVKR